MRCPSTIPRASIPRPRGRPPATLFFYGFRRGWRMVNPEVIRTEEMAVKPDREVIPEDEKSKKPG